VHTIASVTPTLCDLFGVGYPALCSAPPFDLGGDGRPARVEKALVLAADAIGRRLVEAYAESFAPVLAHAPLRRPATAMLPSITPVCFASMFTGAPPEAHGIRRAERPVLRCDTLFDAFVRAGRRVAIVAVQHSSIDVIFRDRDLDYYSEPYDPEVRARTKALIHADRHDLIVAYEQAYDDRMHETVPESPEALRAMTDHVESFEALAAAARRRWAGVPHAVAFVSDHGTHIDPKTGRGTHGSDLSDDLEVDLFWGVWGAAWTTTSSSTS
jgi:hypothetical protein